MMKDIKNFGARRFSPSPAWKSTIPNHCPWQLAHHRCQWQLALDILLALRLRCPVSHSNTSFCHPTRTLEFPLCNHMEVTLSGVGERLSLVAMSAGRYQAG